LSIQDNVKSQNNFLYKVFEKGILKTIDRNKPDLVIQTFPFHLKKPHKIPQIVFITDYNANAS